MSVNDSINWFSAIGLLLDILGVVVIFIWGPPAPYAEPDKYVEEMYTEEQIRVNRKIKRLSLIGLALIGIGFSFQFIGLFV